MKIKRFSSISILLMLIISLFTMACNKEKGDVTPNVLRKVDKVTISDGTDNQFTYDAMGRRTRIDRKKDTSYVAYKYVGNNVIATTTYANPSKSAPEFTYTLNAKGLAATRTYISSSTTSFLDEYEYDKDGFLLKISTKYKSSTSSTFAAWSEQTYTYDSDGNLLSLNSHSFISSTSDSNNKFEYDKSHYNTTSTDFTGLEFIGKSSPHSVSKITYTPPNSGIVQVTTNTWKYDSKGYNISNVSVVTGATTTTTTFNYTYK